MGVHVLQNAIHCHVNFWVVPCSVISLSVSILQGNLLRNVLSSDMHDYFNTFRETSLHIQLIFFRYIEKTL